MTQFLFVTAIVAFAVTAGIGSAHLTQPRELSIDELAQREHFFANGKRSLTACANSEPTRLLKERALARRAAKVQQLRRDRRLDVNTVMNTNHKSSQSGITASTDPSEIFSSEVSCILAPETTQGPYYVGGEYIRNDIREDQPGVELYMDLQLVDVNTCEAVKNLYVDVWNCNTTGVYAGVVARGNGNSDDASNINTTFCRGLWPTDADGVVSFHSIFPGHYTGRTTHIHVMGSYNGQVLPNNTYYSSVAAEVTQIFFDQDLIDAVEATKAYAINTQSITLNSEDQIFNQAAADDWDPMMEYVYLGDSVEDGIFAWISIGVDMTVAHEITPAEMLPYRGSTAGGMTASASGSAATIDGNSVSDNTVSSFTGSGTTPSTSSSDAIHVDVVHSLLSMILLCVTFTIAN